MPKMSLRQRRLARGNVRPFEDPVELEQDPRTAARASVVTPRVPKANNQSRDMQGGNPVGSGGVVVRSTFSRYIEPVSPVSGRGRGELVKRAEREEERRVECDCCWKWTRWKIKLNYGMGNHITSTLTQPAPPLPTIEAIAHANTSSSVNAELVLKVLRLALPDIDLSQVAIALGAAFLQSANHFSE
ncbi:hypothetical protein BT69DRAFT_1399826 [Atractiella rhizophila]|nr:hypothetical protein BT69DRAFT_1399826 [Atractiella rhizophila]